MTAAICKEILGEIDAHLFDSRDVLRLLKLRVGCSDWSKEWGLKEEADKLIRSGARRKWLRFRAGYRKWELTARFYLEAGR